ncbi:PML-RARA-regulated adapter molecule 1 [Lemur catta]|uniref:PML-RARA-regulated adapter molecule 1 n=1 Tax=Lemur catta TaxID=9447 RepID=UPI001E2674C3|nr:PML-RARA-regulated adapter molecule 1 [Lemur catta]
MSRPVLCLGPLPLRCTVGQHLAVLGTPTPLEVTPQTRILHCPSSGKPEHSWKQALFLLSPSPAQYPSVVPHCPLDEDLVLPVAHKAPPQISPSPPRATLIVSLILLENTDMLIPVPQHVHFRLWVEAIQVDKLGHQLHTCSQPHSCHITSQLDSSGLCVPCSFSRAGAICRRPSTARPDPYWEPPRRLQIYKGNWGDTPPGGGAQSLRGTPVHERWVGPSNLRIPAEAIPASLPSSSAFPTPLPGSPHPVCWPVEQKPQSLPEGSSPSSGPNRPVAHHLPAAMEGHQDFRSLQAKFQTSQAEPSELPRKPPKPDFNKLKKFPQPELSEQPKKSLHPEFGAVSLKPPQPELADLPKKPSKPEFSEVSKKFPQFEATQFPKKPPQPEFADLPKKPPQPEFADLPRKPPQPEFADLPRKPPQPEFADLPRKPPQPEFADLPKKPPQPEFADLPRKPPQPEFADLPRKPPQPEFSELSKKFPKLEATQFSRKSPQPEVDEAPRKALLPEPSTLVPKPLQPEFSKPAKPPSEPKFSAFPRKFPQPESSETTLKPSQHEFSTFPKNPPQPQVGGLPKKSLPQLESSEVPQMPPWKPEPSEPHPHSPKPDFSEFPKKPPQPEFHVYPKKPPQPQVGGLPKKSLPQLESSEVPQTPLSKPEPSEPHAHSPKPDFGALPKKAPQPLLGDLPQKPLQPAFGDLTRTSSEPEVSVLPKRSRQPEFKVPSKKPPQQPELGGLPRTSSEPEFNSFPRKFLQPEHRGPPRKLSQPEPNALLKRHQQTELFGDLRRKPLLPSSVSESSLPTAVAGSSHRLLFSPGFGAPGTPRWRSGGLKPGQPPRRRPLPSVSSLGPPPAKPPLPPGPLDIQRFWRPPRAAADLRRTRSSAGIHFQARQPEVPPQDPDEIYEMYDDVEPTDDSGPSPRGRGEMPLTQQAARRPPQDPAPRKEKASQPQQVPPTDPKLLKQIRKAEKAEREFRKKFKFEGEIVVHTKMMIDPNAKTRRGGGKHLGIRRGEILEVIEYTSKEEMLCRDPKGKYGYVPRTALLPLETEVYDDVGFWDPLESQALPRGP